MTATLRVVLGDQLSRSLSSLRDLDAARDTVLIAEVMGEATYVPHHPKKIAFLFTAMRHFAEGLRADGIRVRYVTLEDAQNTGSLRGEVVRAAEALAVDRIVATEPGEWRVAEDMAAWSGAAGRPVEIRTDTRFLASIADFNAWADGRKQLRMEYFYREMRRRYGILLDAAGGPEGGHWNYDAENRKPPKAGLAPPTPPQFPPDDTTHDVLDLVARTFTGRHFGDLQPFGFAVTQADAAQVLDHFIARALPQFGDYQDAMVTDQPWLFHAVIGLYLNAGLLDPLDTIRRVEAAYRDGRAPLAAAEGFIRQILGWREYVRGIYWRYMPGYAETNHLDAGRPLPDFYWSGDTDLHCLSQAIGQTRRHAYAHHIQRLMVTGNFALLAGVDPKAVCEWYLVVYADAYEWVELPNTHGMALFADGGTMASKPYAASGAYIDRMSNYCRSCRYDVKQKAGPNACPFNYLYWNFLMENRPKLAANQRLGMVYRTLDKMDDGRKASIRADSRRFLDQIGIGQSSLNGGCA